METERLIVRKKTAKGVGAVAANGTVTLILANVQAAPDVIPGYTKVAGIPSVDKDLITVGYRMGYYYVTFHNWHSATQDVTVTMTYIYERDSS